MTRDSVKSRIWRIFVSFRDIFYRILNLLEKLESKIINLELICLN